MIEHNRIAYEIDELTGTLPSQQGNAPVTRVAWSSKDLPKGLTLSEDGELTGHPTVAGTYDCEIEVVTNWGKDRKTIRIIIKKETNN